MRRKLGLETLEFGLRSEHAKECQRFVKTGDRDHKYDCCSYRKKGKVGRRQTQSPAGDERDSDIDASKRESQQGEAKQVAMNRYVI